MTVRIVNGRKYKVCEKSPDSDFCINCGREFPKDNAVCQKNFSSSKKRTQRKRPNPAKPLAEPSGVGTELKAIIYAIGFKSIVDCDCGKRQAEMDSMGPKWCRENIGEIASWLQGEAKKRVYILPPLAVVHGLIKLAIKRAEEKHGSSAKKPR